MNRASQRSARFGLPGKLLLVPCALAAALGLAELLVRVTSTAPAFKAIATTGEQTTYRRSTNPLLGYELKVSYRNPAADFRESYPSTNAHGQRDIERSLAKSAGTRRILLLGDSVVEGHGLREIDDTISRRLEQLYPDGRTEVLNFGVSGYCTRAEVELLETKGLEFAPDVVVVLFTENDFINFNREAFQLGAASERPGWVRLLFRRSDLFRLAAVRLDWFHYGIESDPLAFNRDAIGDNNVADGLRRLAELADRFGFQALVAVWPHFEDDGVRDLHPSPTHTDELIVESLAAAYGIPVVRLSGFFRQDLTATDRGANPRLRYTLGDKLHPSVEGAKVAAQALHALLESPSFGPETGRPTVEPSAETTARATEAARALGAIEADYAAVHNNNGLALFEEGRLDEAIAEYREALEISPRFVKARSNLGNALSAQMRYDEAIEQFRQALQINPDQAEIHNNLGVALGSSGRVDQAIRGFRRAVELQPDYADARNNLGVALSLTGDAAGALAQLGEAARLRPEWPTPLTDMAWILATHPDPSIRDPERAVEYGMRAARLLPGPDPVTVDTIAAAFAAAGQFERAVDLAQKAAALAEQMQDPGLAAEIGRRLELYRGGRPYVERASGAE